MAPLTRLAWIERSGRACSESEWPLLAGATWRHLAQFGRTDMVRFSGQAGVGAMAGPPAAGVRGAQLGAGEGRPAAARVAAAMTTQGCVI